MKALDSEMTGLLDKLYNLRGEDSVVLVSMDKESKKAVETRDRTSEQKTTLQSKINELTEDENVLAEEGEKLKETLGKINKEDFATVIDRLKIDFDPEAIKTKVETSLPKTLEKVAKEKKDAADELVKVEDEMNAAISKIEELSIRRDEALANQEKLNKYFELALDANINITRDEITSLLAEFNFTEEEQREAAKILMFPEDGLFEYEKKIQDKPVASKSISEVIQEAKEEATVDDKEEISEEEVEVKEETNASKAEDIVAQLADIMEDDSKINEEKEVKIEEPLYKEPKDSLNDLLKEYGFDGLDFPSSEIEKILDNYDESLIRKNIDAVNRLKIEKSIFNDNIELFYDDELEDKLNRLIEIGKAPQDIYLNPSVLVKYSLSELNHAIDLLKESGLEPKSVPLMAY